MRQKVDALHHHRRDVRLVVGADPFNCNSKLLGRRPTIQVSLARLVSAFDLRSVVTERQTGDRMPTENLWKNLHANFFSAQ